MKITKNEKDLILKYLQEVQADFYKRKHQLLGKDRIVDVDLSRVVTTSRCDRFNLGAYKLLVTLEEGSGFVFFGRMMHYDYASVRATIIRGDIAESPYIEAPYKRGILEVPFCAAWEEDDYPPLHINSKGKTLLLTKVYLEASRNCSYIPTYVEIEKDEREAIEDICPF